MKKAQSAIEFVIMISVLIFFFVTMVMIINYNLSDKYREREEAVVRDIAYSIQDELNIASKATDGYCRPFEVQQEVLGKDYEIYTNFSSQGLIEVKTSRASIVLPLPADIDKSSEQIRKRSEGFNIVKKQAGIVKLNDLSWTSCTS